MASLLRMLGWSMGCALSTAVRTPPPPPSHAPPIAVRGPTDSCRATYVFEGPVYLDADEPRLFRQYSGTLDGADFGACTLMGPTPAGDWLWVLMSFEPGFRGSLSCWVGSQRSPTLVVMDAAAPLPEQVRARYLFMDPMQLAERVVPMGLEPCPDLSPADGVQGPAFR